MNSTAVAENANRMSKEELLDLKEAMNQKALTKKRIKTATTIAANIMVTLVVLLPLLYAVSIALCHRESYLQPTGTCFQKVQHFKILKMR